MMTWLRPGPPTATTCCVLGVVGIFHTWGVPLLLEMVLSQYSTVVSVCNRQKHNVGSVVDGIRQLGSANTVNHERETNNMTEEEINQILDPCQSKTCGRSSAGHEDSPSDQLGQEDQWEDDDESDLDIYEALDLIQRSYVAINEMISRMPPGSGERQHMRKLAAELSEFLSWHAEDLVVEDGV